MDKYEKKLREELQDEAADYEVVAWIEREFPELVESEDERIRKEIISALKFANDGGVYDRHIAYLEKQKELPFVKDVVLGYPGLYFYDGERMHFRGSPAMEEKQKEHFRDVTKMVEQKPAEWSEEDKDKVAQYLHDRDGGMLWSKATEITSDILDILHPQPKAELTLLDKNIINAAVAFVEQNDHFNYWGGIDKHTVIKALRSIKPSWKPSEEQMDNLRDTIIQTKGFSYSMFLPQLYEDLKKLM